MIKGPEDAAHLSAKLQDWKALSANPAWQEVLAKIADYRKVALDGMTSRTKTPEQRAEWLEAYHAFEELAGFVGAQAEKMETELREWMRREGGPISMRVLDAME